MNSKMYSEKIVSLKKMRLLISQNSLNMPFQMLQKLETDMEYQTQLFIWMGNTIHHSYL